MSDMSTEDLFNNLADRLEAKIEKLAKTERDLADEKKKSWQLEQDLKASANVVESLRSQIARLPNEKKDIQELWDSACVLVKAMHDRLNVGSMSHFTEEVQRLEKAIGHSGETSLIDEIPF